MQPTSNNSSQLSGAGVPRTDDVKQGLDANGLPVDLFLELLSGGGLMLSTRSRPNEAARINMDGNVLVNVGTTGLSEGSPLRFRLDPNASKEDFGAILLNQIKKVNAVAAEKLASGIETLRGQLRACKDVGCKCPTPEGQRQYINDLLLNSAKTRFDKTGIQMLLNYGGLSDAESRRLASEYANFSLKLADDSAAAGAGAGAGAAAADA